MNQITEKIENDTLKKIFSEYYNDLEEVIIGSEEIFDETFTEEYLQISQVVIKIKFQISKVVFVKLNFFTENIILILNTWSQKIFEMKMSMIGKPFLSLDSIYVDNSEYTLSLDDQLRKLKHQKFQKT